MNLDALIQQQVAAVAPAFDVLPGVVIIHNIRNWKVVHMSQRGLELLNMPLKELTEMEGTEYYARFFNEEDAKDYVPKILGLLERNNNDEVTSFFQQVRFFNNDAWHWHTSAVKIFMRDEEGKPLLTITYAIKLDPKHHFTNKVDRLLSENDFLRKNYEKFNTLTKQEKVLLKELALGKTSTEIAAGMHIAILTADTHRRNIKKKLEITNTYELAEYARAFNLI